MSLTFNSCRICLEVKPQDSVKSLLVVPIDLGASYAQLYQECIGVSSIAIKEHLPSYLCFECEKLLLKFRKFRLKCLKTEEILNGLLPIKVESEKYLNFDQVLVQELTEGTKDLVMKDEDFDHEVKQEKEIVVPVQIEAVDKPKSKKIPAEDDPKVPKKRKRTRNSKTEEHDPVDKETKQKMKKEHESRREICQQCGKMIAHKYMRLHLMTHLDIADEDRQYQCEQCLKRFKFAHGLAKHKEGHTGLKRYKCDHCELTFARSDGRRYHIMIKHLNEKPFQCTLCSKRFTREHHVTQHQRVHTMERNFKCLICNKMLASKAALGEHKETHTDELNFICDVCNKGFKTKKYLKRHYVVHTGEKNYLCSLCNEKFAYNVLLKSHYAKLHPDFELPPSGTLMSERAIKRMDEDYKKFLKIQTTKDLTVTDAAAKEVTTARTTV